MFLNYRRSALLLAVSTALAATPSFAEKPSWAGGEKAGKHEQKNKSSERRDDARGDRRHLHSSSGITVNAYFGDRERRVVRDYYADQFRAGHCPPGLAKKHNGCMPPGQAKKWSVGHRLPSDVIYHTLPAEISIRLGTPPARHRFVRVASDILLIAVGTGMVVDAIEDLSRM